MKVLFVTAMYPHAVDPSSGTFVMHQAEQLRLMGHDVDVLFFRGYRSKLNYITAVLRVFYKTLTDSYDVVHAHYGLSGIPALFRWRVPLVITLHGSDALLGRLQPFLSKLVCRMADAVIVVSKNIASRIAGEVIPCGVNLGVFKPFPREEARTRLGLSLQRRYVLFPFDPNRKVKRFDLAKSAVECLVAFGLDSELLVVSGIENYLMPIYFSAADVMILCSDSEGSPTSVKEALACNLPVVCTDVGDIDEIARETEGVLICNPDADSLSKGLKHFLSLGRMVDCRAAVAKYDQLSTAKSIVEVYKRIARRRQR